MSASLDCLDIVRLDDLLLHEEHDPARLQRLRQNMSAEGVQANPVIVSRTPDGRFLILDGAHRVHALGSLGCSLALVQVVDSPPEPESWSHILSGVFHDDFVQTGDPANPVSEPVASIITPDGGSTDVFPESPDLTAWVSVLRGLQAMYPGDTTVTRVEEPSRGEVPSLKDGEVQVTYRAFSVPELIKVVAGGEVLPAGITRFRIPERVLGVKFPLRYLKTDDPEAARSRLKTLIDDGVGENRVRRYDEPVVLFE